MNAKHDTQSLCLLTCMAHGIDPFLGGVVDRPAPDAYPGIEDESRLYACGFHILEVLGNAFF